MTSAVVMRAMEPERAVHPAALPRDDLRWTTRPTCPPDWWAHLLRCGGAFFHTPAGLEEAAPPGDTLFAELVHGHEVIGIAAGVQTRCRFGMRPKHVYFPTLPAIICGPRREAALAALRESLGRDGVAEVTFGALDASWRPELGADGVGADPSIEFVVPLEPGADLLPRRFIHDHVLRLRRGDREGWTLRIHEGAAAWALFSRTSRGLLPRASSALAGGGSQWGATAFTAWENGTPLAAVLIGFAARRAYCLRARLTPAGAARQADIWLHWRAMRQLAERDFDTYNLGATSTTAVISDDPGHEAFRLRIGFGPEVVHCRGARWTLRAGHMRAHRVVHWLATQFPPVSALL